MQLDVVTLMPPQSQKNGEHFFSHGATVVTDAWYSAKSAQASSSMTATLLQPHD
jgi:hypothetical protein